jgi:Putative Mg2+ and Co2+ transporter CorB
VILIFGEIVPKAFGLGNAETWSLRVARPVQLVERALSPIITALEVITSRLNALLSADSEIEKPYVD